MNALIPFDYEGSSVRVLTGEDGQPWFVAADVARILEIGNPSQAMTRLDDDERTLISNEGRDLNVVSEAGLYSLILGSRKPEAKAFKRWVTHEVLPAIRRHGVYATPDTVEAMLQDPDTMIATLTALKTEREARQALQAQAEADRPKVIFADAVAASHSTILIGDLAKLLRQNGVEIGANRLFEWMRRNGFLIARKGTDRNMPTQRAQEMGLFWVKETAITHSDGHVTVSRTPKVTGKGQEYFVSRFLDGRFTTEEAAA
ncbi:phage antirepressor [Actinomyces urogenitalis]|uniref:phage antirepressor n=1 Tax=Actinomyces urogenitalis TaxID=103621 RepID=UPI0029004CC7|nr:phage antirepressor [Actinomyces urogenitalis]MDU0864456.1 phage antirepressor [Actinomyces urogenitalis]MDU0875002.1 phage antirepressor [Actinomyces urogenitalis]MDU1565327.1 phage antirepressor [Actinomyces urogenitalis]MDU1640570.1 phage antirepressor [Actinomyces urogenitalis]MDU6777744.1 phage antirepressor [Actinomyces urogenitalis]